MNKEILDELNKIAEGFWYDKKTLDRVRIENISSLYVGGFARHFDSALKEFLMVRKWNMENHDSSFDKILGVNPVKEYSDACDKFLEVVTTAKTNDLIIDKQLVKELDDYKNKYVNLESDLRNKESAIEHLQEIKTQLDERIRIHEVMYPDLKRLGKSEESELVEDE